MYNLLADYGSEIRQNQIAIAQQEDEISSLKEQQISLQLEQNDLIQRVSTLELEGKLAKAELLGAETSKLSCDKELDDIARDMEKIKARVATKEGELSRLKNFKARKIADFEKLHRKLEDQYRAMPHVRICVEAKRNYEEVASKLKDSQSKVIKLTEELASIRKVKCENWTEFKGICVAIAQNNGLVQRMRGELETLSLQKRRLDEMAERANVNQESVSSTSDNDTTPKRGGEHLSVSDKLLKLHSRSKSISRSNISQRVIHPLPKSVGTLNRPVMLTSLTRLKSIPSALVGKARGFSSSHVSSLLEIKQRLAAVHGLECNPARPGISALNKPKASSAMHWEGVKSINDFRGQLQEEPMEIEVENYEGKIGSDRVSNNESNKLRLPLASARSRLNQSSAIKIGPTTVGIIPLPINPKMDMDVTTTDRCEDFGNKSRFSRFSLNRDAPPRMKPSAEKLDFMTDIARSGGISPNNTGFICGGFFGESDMTENKLGEGNVINKKTDDILSIFGWSPQQKDLF